MNVEFPLRNFHRQSMEFIGPVGDKCETFTGRSGQDRVRDCDAP
jgi:hypothetical protein